MKFTTASAAIAITLTVQLTTALPISSPGMDSLKLVQRSPPDIAQDVAQGLSEIQSSTGANAALSIVQTISDIQKIGSSIAVGAFGRRSHV